MTSITLLIQLITSRLRAFLISIQLFISEFIYSDKFAEKLASYRGIGYVLAIKKINTKLYSTMKPSASVFSILSQL